MIWPRRSRGFTLIELMIYIGLATVVIGAVLGVESVVRVSTIQQGLRLELHEDRLRIGNWFRRDVGHAVEARLLDGGRGLTLQMASGSEIKQVVYRLDQAGQLLRIIDDGAEQRLGRGQADIRFEVKAGGLVLLETTLARTVPRARAETQSLRLAAVLLLQGAR